MYFIYVYFVVYNKAVLLFFTIIFIPIILLIVLPHVVQTVCVSPQLVSEKGYSRLDSYDRCEISLVVRRSRPNRPKASC